MKEAKQAWAVLADERHAFLVQVDPGREGYCHVQELDRLVEHWEPREHTRPSPLGNKKGHDYASFHHEAEERLTRFAHELSRWVGKQVQAHQIKQLTLFAPPKLMGTLRPMWGARLSKRINEHEADLAHRPPNRLAEHQAIKELVWPRE